MAKKKKFGGAPVTLPWLSPDFQIEAAKVGQLLIQTDNEMWFIDANGGKQGPFWAVLDQSSGKLKQSSTYNPNAGQYLTINNVPYDVISGAIGEKGMGTGTLHVQGTGSRNNANWSSDDGVGA